MVQTTLYPLHYVCPYQRPCSVQQGLVGQEVLLGRVVATVGQLVVLDQEAEVRHLPDLQLWGLRWVASKTKGQTSNVNNTDVSSLNYCL